MVKKQKVGGLAADVVRDGGPEEAAAHVEETQQADEADSGGGTDGSFAFEEVLDHRRGLLKNADAGRYVGTENDPQQKELRGLPCDGDVDVVRGDER
jgi:hypothetical protein